DLLLHVVDASSPYHNEYIDVVRNTLKEIGAKDKPEILVLNKVDAITDDAIFTALRRDHPNGVMISAIRGIGIDRLQKEIVVQTTNHYKNIRLELPIG